jgi:hypothetical protein
MNFISGEGSGATSESSAGSSLLMPHQHSLLPSLAHHVQQQQQQQQSAAAAASVSSLLASQQHQHQQQQSNAQQQQQQISSNNSLASSLSGLGVASDVINGLGSLTGGVGGGWAVSAPPPSAVKRRAPTHACPVCGKHYVNEGSLRKHLAAHPETAHITSALRMWPCSICPAVFPHETGTTH